MAKFNYEFYLLIRLRKLLGNVEVNTLISSPFREDNNPSFFITLKGKSMVFIDFGRKGIEGSWRELKQLVKTHGIVREEELRYTYEKAEKIYINATPITPDEFCINYYRKWRISKKTLQKYNVYTCKRFIMSNKKHYIYPRKCIVYFVNGNAKLLSPKANPRYKWRSSLSKNDIEGLAQIQGKGSILIITKALKECMFYHEMGYDAIAAPSESVMINSALLYNLRLNYSVIILALDNDEQGKLTTQKYIDQHGSDFFHIHYFNEKNITDEYETDIYVKQRFHSLCRKLITKHEEKRLNDGSTSNLLF